MIWALLKSRGNSGEVGTTCRTKSSRPLAERLAVILSAGSPCPSVSRQIADCAACVALCTPASASSSSLVSFVSSAGPHGAHIKATILFLECTGEAFKPLEGKCFDVRLHRHSSRMRMLRPESSLWFEESFELTALTCLTSGTAKIAAEWEDGTQGLWQTCLAINISPSYFRNLVEGTGSLAFKDCMLPGMLSGDKQCWTCSWLLGGRSLHGGGQGAKFEAGKAVLEDGGCLGGSGAHCCAHVLPKFLHNYVLPCIPKSWCQVSLTA